MARTIECVTNISEGRRLEVVGAVAAAVDAVPGVRMLDIQSDKDHNRSVLTFVGDEEALAEASFRLFEAALPAIDLRTHQGEHPRLGAVDVVPFVPVEDATMDECVGLARRVGAEVARRFSVPVFLYEEAARAPHRRNLEDIRRGQFEGLAEKLKDPQWAPDFGPATPHPSAGASVIGARAPLIAFNINLDTPDIQVAKAIAKTIRTSSGGFPCVKAMGVRLEARNIAQVSINMTDYRRTPLFQVFDAVCAEAERLGVTVVGSEIVGLLPAAALANCSEQLLRLENFRPSQILEYRIKATE